VKTGFALCYSGFSSDPYDFFDPETTVSSDGDY